MDPRVWAICATREGRWSSGGRLDGGQELLKEREALHSLAPWEAEFQEVSLEPYSLTLLQLVPCLVWVGIRWVLGGCWLDGVQV